MRPDRDHFDALLVRWHRWSSDPKQSTDALMRQFDNLVGELRSGYQVVLILEARNLACGAAVWSSARYSRVGSKGDKGRARSALMRMLAKDQPLWFGRQLVQFNARGNRVGESNPRAGLTDHEVDLMREMREEQTEAGQPRYSLGWLAIKFKVPKSTVQMICSGHRRGQSAAQVREV